MTNMLCAVSLDNVLLNKTSCIRNVNVEQSSLGQKKRVLIELDLNSLDRQAAKVLARALSIYFLL